MERGEQLRSCRFSKEGVLHATALGRYAHLLGYLFLKSHLREETLALHRIASPRRLTKRTRRSNSR